MSPFPIDNDEVEIAALIVLVGMVLLTGMFLLLNLAARQGLRSWRPAAFWSPAIAVQFLPFLWFMFAPP